jgi:PhnB protein
MIGNHGTRLNPYLNFNGNCREAMIFYKECIGGELVLQKVSESPMAAQLPSKAGTNILHGSLTQDEIVLMGSDMIGENLVGGNSITLCLNCSSQAKMEIYFTRLSTGGKVKTPLHQTFGGSTYGELTDRFGVNWMLNLVRPQHG